jgi:hypothetical protein
MLLQLPPIPRQSDLSQRLAGWTRRSACALALGIVLFVAVGIVGW